MTYCCSPQDPMDCIERATCPKAGQHGHGFCGTCAVHNKPNHRCGCFNEPAIVDSFDAITTEWDSLDELGKQAKLDENMRELELLFDCE